MTITEFLKARIAEDEAAASRAGSFTPWSETFQTDNYGHLTVQPGRVLAECEAKRLMLAEHPIYRGPRLLEVHSAEIGYACERCHAASAIDDDSVIEALGDCGTLRALALPYTDHPDFREEWRVS